MKSRKHLTSKTPLLKRYAGGTQVPAGLYLESWFDYPIPVCRGDTPLPGPAHRRFVRLSPLASLLLAPFLGTIFVLGFLVLTLLVLPSIPFVAIWRLLRRNSPRGGIPFLFGAVLISGLFWGSAVQGSSQESCLKCHRFPLKLRLGNGESVSLQIHLEVFEKSVHGRTLQCQACHRDIQKVPHERRTFADRRDLSLHYSKYCTTCHSGKFVEFQEGIHWQILSKGDRRAPFCADCHGAHTVSKNGVARNRVSRTCAKCHSQVSERYEKSAHGRTLLNGNNLDVPTCTTCHQSHTAKDPRKVKFRIDIPKLCAGCHQNEAIMSRYGISTQVVSTYLQDFHGMSLHLYSSQSTPPPRLTAVCTDCHGIHDIRSTRDPGSQVIKANLLRTCQKCHPGATSNFPAAWLSHYVPSPKRAALVYFVKLFYLLFLPGVVGCVVLHVGLDLVREIKDRCFKHRKEE